MTDFRPTRGPAILYALLILAVGLAYRLSFVYQGWSATDEGWLQAAGIRIASGQVPYRDFEYPLPPVTIYKEAALAAVTGPGWTVLASRWLFSFEVTLASLLAFLILRRAVSDRTAFFVTLPTVFFTVMILAFTNYTYDAEFWALVSVTLAVYAGEGRRQGLVALAAGGAAGLAAMAKSPFLAFLPAIPFAALAGSWLRRGRNDAPQMARSLQRVWLLYLAGAAIVIGGFFAYFASIGLLRSFVEQAFLLTARANPVSLRFALIQDLPDYAVRFGRLGIGVTAIILLLLPFAINRLWEFVRTVLLLGALAYVLLYTQLHPPIPSRPYFINIAYFVVSGVGVIALLVSLILETPWLARNETAAGLRSRFPPLELIFLALFLQWLAQFHYDGLVFWFVGSYLSVPVVLIFLRELGRVRIPVFRGATRLRFGAPAVAWVLIATWLSIGGAGIFLERVYQDADRPLLTASFSPAKLSGITTYPETAQRVDALVAEVDRRTKPGDPIFFFPDYGIMYAVTGRTNPTPLDWYNEAFLTPAVTDQVLAALQRDPPRVVFLQRQREGAYQRDQPPVDYVHSKWAPIFLYLIAHYRVDGGVQDIAILVPAGP